MVKRALHVNHVSVFTAWAAAGQAPNVDQQTTDCKASIIRHTSSRRSHEHIVSTNPDDSQPFE